MEARRSGKVQRRLALQPVGEPPLDMRRPARHQDGRLGCRAEPHCAAPAGRLDPMAAAAQRNALTGREAHPLGTAGDAIEDPCLLRRREGQRRPL